jgi:predicted amidohydrolase
MRIAIMQTAGESGVVEPNLDRLAGKAAEAAERDVQLLVCPEMYLTGYNVEPAIITRLAEPSGGPAARRVSEIARKHRIAVLYGYAECNGSAIYNAAQLIDANGQPLANCRKSHLFGHLDRRTFTAGESLTQTKLDGVPMGILICYDVEFPEPVRSLALAGAAVVLVPTALMKPHEFVANALIPVRAWENQLFVAYANRCGSEGELDYVGLSTIAGPRGEIVAQAGAGESLLIADLDLSARERAQRYFSYLDDRRPDLYRGEH